MQETPMVKERVLYPSEDDIYPNLPDIQGTCCDENGNVISVEDFVEMKCGNIGEGDIALHPKSTHLLFWDLPGTRRGAKNASF
jgi:hypothetical protein